MRIDAGTETARPGVNEAIARTLLGSVHELVEQALYETPSDLRVAPSNIIRPALRLALTKALQCLAQEKPPGQNDHRQMYGLVAPLATAIDLSDFLPALYDQAARTLWNEVQLLARDMGVQSQDTKQLGWMLRGWRDEMVNWLAIEMSGPPEASLATEVEAPPQSETPATLVVPPTPSTQQPPVAAPVAPTTPPASEPTAKPAIAFVVALASPLLPVLGAIAALFVIRRTQKRMGSREQGRGLLVSAFVIAISTGILWIVAIALSLASSPAPEEEDLVRVLGLGTGTCFNLSESGSSGVIPVRCGAPHDAEVVSRIPYRPIQSRYPGERRIGSFAERQCTTESQEVVGNNFPRGLRFAQYFPNRAAWRQGARDMVCALVRGADSNRLRGSLIERG